MISVARAWVLVVALAGPVHAAEFRFTTWNLEWLSAQPVSAEVRARRAECVGRWLSRLDAAAARPEAKGYGRGDPTNPGNIRSPGKAPPRDDAACDRAPRIDADYAALARYAREVGADVYALQEVDGEEAAARVFPRSEYSLHFTKKPADAARVARGELLCDGAAIACDPQQVGFAVRRSSGIRVRHFAAEPGLSRIRSERQADGVERSPRFGAELAITLPDGRELAVLTVHLKSGCKEGELVDRRPGEVDRDSCSRLAQQLPPLEAWVDRTAQRGPFILLGDFNRAWDAPGSADYRQGSHRSLFAELDDGMVNDDPGRPLAELHLTDVTRDKVPPRCGRHIQPPCRKSGGGSARACYIDHILVSASLAPALDPVRNSRPMMLYRHLVDPRDEAKAYVTDADRYQLSDHCPVSAVLRF